MTFSSIFPYFIFTFLSLSVFFFWGKHFGSSWAIGWRGIGRYTETVVQKSQEIKWQTVRFFIIHLQFFQFQLQLYLPCNGGYIATIGNKDGLNYPNALLRLEYI